MITEHITTVYSYNVNGVRYADVVEVDQETGTENSVVFVAETWPAMQALIEKALNCKSDKVEKYIVHALSQ